MCFWSFFKQRIIRKRDPRSSLPPCSSPILILADGLKYAGFSCSPHVLRDGPLPLVVTDVWYLNDERLRLQPTLAIGDPAVNAASAMFAGKLPCAFAVENACQLLLDPELLDPRACLWGVDEDSTRVAIERFEAKWLEEFLDAAEHVCEA